MSIDIKRANADQLRDYLLSSTSCGTLGAEAEKHLQECPDYVQAKKHVEDNQRKLALWDGMKSYSGVAGVVMSGLFVGAATTVLGALMGQSLDGKGGPPPNLDSALSNPLLYAKGAGVAGLTGLNVYSNYRAGLIYHDNSIQMGESSARKGAEMGKLHAMHQHEVSIANAEITAQLVGKEVENAMERSFAKHQCPSPTMSHIASVQGLNSSMQMARA